MYLWFNAQLGQKKSVSHSIYSRHTSSYNTSLYSVFFENEKKNNYTKSLRGINTFSFVGYMIKLYDFLTRNGFNTCVKSIMAFRPDMDIWPEMAVQPENLKRGSQMIFNSSLFFQMHFFSSIESFDSPLMAESFQACSTFEWIDPTSYSCHVDSVLLYSKFEAKRIKYWNSKFKYLQIRYLSIPRRTWLFQIFLRDTRNIRETDFNI